MPRSSPRKLRPLRLLCRVTALAGLMWLGFATTVALRQRHMLFSPLREPIVPQPRSTGHRTRSVVLRAQDGTRLCGWLCTPRAPGPHPAVLYFGGRAEEVSWVVRDAERLFPGMTLLALNYRGYGRSHGRPAERLLVRDAHAALDWLLQSGAHVDPQRIALVGRSLGSSIALQLAARRPVTALVLLTPFDSVLAMVRRRLPAMPVGWMLRDRFESIRIARQVAAPILVLRAESDDIVPTHHTDTLVASLPNLIADEVVPASNHADIPYLLAAQERIAGFLQEKLERRVVAPSGAPVTLRLLRHESVVAAAIKAAETAETAITPAIESADVTVLKPTLTHTLPTTLATSSNSAANGARAVS